MEWLVAVIKLIEKQNYKNLFVARNNSLKINAFKVSKEWNSAYLHNENEINNTIVINSTRVVNYILSITKDYIYYPYLLNLVKTKFNNANEEIINNILIQLINNEFLVSNLRIPLQNCNPMKEIIDYFDKESVQDDIVDELKSIYLMMQNYNNLRITNGEMELKQIIDKMEIVKKANNYIQIDMYSLSDIFVEKDLKKNLEKFILMLNKFSYENTYFNYMDKFEEKYGNVAVKYLDAIDEEKGIGLPKKDEIKNLERKIEFLKAVSKYINKHDDIYLDLKDINFESKNNYKLNEKEIAFYIIKDNEQYRLICSPLFGSNNVGNISGRFNYLFDQNKKYDVSKIENATYNISFITQQARHLNVAMYCNENQNFMEYGIKSFNKSDCNYLDINNIYMFIEDDKIKFLDSETKEEIKFNLPNMLNNQFYPESIKYLLELSLYQYGNIYSVYYNLMDILYCNEGKYNPIVFENIIIFPKAWKFKFEIDTKKKSYNVFKKQFIQFCKKYEVPNYVLAGYGDQRLLLNITNELHLQILYDDIKKKKEILLFDNIFKLENMVIHDEDNKSYVGEFVFFLEKNSQKKKIHNSIQLVNNKMIDLHSYYLFDEWMSFKIYIDELYQNDVIAKYINYLFYRLQDEKVIEEMFYIRYRDPKNHIRLRIKCSKENQNFVFEKISEIVENLKDINILNDLICDVYRQEFLRYGGELSMTYAENIFTKDSFICSEIIKIQRDVFVTTNVQEIYVISVIKLFEDLGFSYKEILITLDSYKK